MATRTATQAASQAATQSAGKAASVSKDLRGAARLAVDATAGLTDLVEAMHQRIASAPGGTAADGRTRGITGLVYRSIRGVTQLVGGSVDALLGAVQLLLPADKQAARPGPQREAFVAALNGVLGDHLAATNNPLATSMSLRHQGQALVLEREALRERFPEAGGKLLVLVHGLCMNDRQWLREGHSHGAQLALQAGYTPVYLHYNTGLLVAENGRAFEALMQQLLAAWPHRLQRVVLLTHSMGGLVARSALQHAAVAGHTWPRRVKDLVFLGTPHLGAPLERAGHWVDILLGAAPYAAPLARLGQVRSKGITDLRHGRVAPGAHPLPLPAPEHGPRCWAIAGTLGPSQRSVKARVAGDGLVPLASALGQAKAPGESLAFEAKRQWVAEGVNHMALLNDAAVYAKLLQWLGPKRRSAAVSVTSR
jgi:hypothetical protein